MKIGDNVYCINDFELYRKKYGGKKIYSIFVKDKVYKILGIDYDSIALECEPNYDPYCFYITAERPVRYSITFTHYFFDYFINLR